MLKIESYKNTILIWTVLKYPFILCYKNIDVGENHKTKPPISHECLKFMFGFIKIF